MSTSRIVPLPFIIIPLIIIVALAIGLFIGIRMYMYKNQSMLIFSHTKELQKSQVYKPCPLPKGYGKKEQYLNNYIVKNGDSLLSISNTQLGDPSRVNEIITLNKDKYPSLSFKNSFIEVGWQFLLPHRHYGITNGHIEIIHGNFFNYSGGWGWGVTRGGDVENFGIGPFPFEELEKYSHLNLKDGDCITLVYQEPTGSRNIPKALELFRQ